MVLSRQLLCRLLVSTVLECGGIEYQPFMSTTFDISIALGFNGNAVMATESQIAENSPAYIFSSPIGSCANDLEPDFYHFGISQLWGKKHRIVKSGSVVHSREVALDTQRKSLERNYVSTQKYCARNATM